MLKNVLLTGAAAAALAAVSFPARADNIVTNSWYTGHFTGSETPLLGNSGIPALNTKDPILPNPITQPLALAAPIANGLQSATITLQHGGFLSATDAQTSGDQFRMFVNGIAATPAASGPTTMVSSGLQTWNDLDLITNALSGLPSLPVDGDRTCGINISCALADPSYSSGMFYLPAGHDTTTGRFLGTIANGNTNLIVGPGPDAGLAGAVRHRVVGSGRGNQATTIA